MRINDAQTRVDIVKSMMNDPAYCNHCQKETETKEWDCIDCRFSKPFPGDEVISKKVKIMSEKYKYTDVKWNAFSGESNIINKTINMSDMKESHIINAYRAIKRKYLQLTAEGERRGMDLDQLILSKTKYKKEDND